MDQETRQYLDERFSKVNEQFAKMAAKEDMAVLESHMATTEDIATLRGEMTTLSTNVAEMINGLATHIDDRFDELTPTIRDVENHEKRIKFLEDRLPKLAKA